ncbi:Mss4-like protein [Parachaetomium inaequale]|uniref:Mss4-like protein n=1 Tax=Parachaetomium inaequale TaxID=2588326 RepID=A0AAN6PCI5_9PEZI|nr:Mss4-like protein [Parachaetomium inaequale]
MAASDEKFPVAGLTRDGWSTEDEATATCFCGAVQLVFPLQAPGLINRHICHCSDCRKISSSFYMSNIVVADTHLRHARGRDALKQFAQAETIRSGGVMTNFFCGTCGTLMYRVGEKFPGVTILRTGTVDDFSLAETKLRPQVEQFVEHRVGWQRPVEGVPQARGMHTPADIEGGKL